MILFSRTLGRSYSLLTPIITLDQGDLIAQGAYRVRSSAVAA